MKLKTKSTWHTQRRLIEGTGLVFSLVFYYYFTVRRLRHEAARTVVMLASYGLRLLSYVGPEPPWDLVPCKVLPDCVSKLPPLFVLFRTIS